MGAGAAGKRRIAAALKAARQGEESLRWLNRAVERAGYVRMAAAADEDVLLTTAAQIGRRFGVSSRTVRSWIREGLTPAVEGHGNRPAWFDVFGFFEWWRAREEARRATTDEGARAAAERIELETEMRREKLREARRRNDVEEGRLVDCEELADHLSQIGRMFAEGVRELTGIHGEQMGEELIGLVDRVEGQWRELLAKQQAERAGERGAK